MRIFYCISLIFMAFSAVACSPAEDLEQRLGKIISGKDAEVGIAVIFNGKDTLTLNNDKQYPMMSVFKFHQALAVADHLAKSGKHLTDKIHIEPEDLQKDTYSPLRDRFPDGNFGISIADLLQYTLQLSDNNACDILFKYIIGVEETDRFIRSLGPGNFSISVNEDGMHKDLNRCYDNWSTPLDAARLLEIFLTQDILQEEYADFIRKTMTECTTGQDRLVKPLLGTDAVIGHKTGTGDRNAEGKLIGTNDIGFVFLPDGSHYTIAVFVKDSGETPEATAKMIADISHAVYECVSAQ